MNNENVLFNEDENSPMFEYVSFFKKNTIIL